MRERGDIAIERHGLCTGGRTTHRERDGEHRIGAEPLEMFAAVEIAQRCVDESLLTGIVADKALRNFPVDRSDRFAHTASSVDCRIAVA